MKCHDTSRQNALTIAHLRKSVFSLHARAVSSLVIMLGFYTRSTSAIAVQMGVAQNQPRGVTQVFVHVSTYQGSIVVPIFLATDRCDPTWFSGTCIHGPFLFVCFHFVQRLAQDKKAPGWEQETKNRGTAIFGAISPWEMDVSKNRNSP